MSGGGDDVARVQSGFIIYSIQSACEACVDVGMHVAAREDGTMHASAGHKRDYCRHANTKDHDTVATP